MISVSWTEGVARTPQGRVANTKRKSSFLDVWFPMVRGDGGGEVMRMKRATTQKGVSPTVLERRFNTMPIGVSMPCRVGECE
jgi:hypothetical protein